VLAERGALAEHVSAEVRLDCGLAVAEHVERRAEAWADVLVVGNVVHLRGAERGPERAGGDVLCPGLAVGLIETEAGVQRQLAQRPLILRVEAETPEPRIRLERAGPLGER